MAGIEFLRATATASFRLAEVDEGRVVFVADPGEQHFNPIGVVHGGLAATLLDSAVGACAHSTPELGQGYTTLETKFTLVRPMTAGMGMSAQRGR